ncbi:MAG: polymer-forming cytoskeletal protein [Candidatus Azambacteria bacterium]|nr:polymer-forming cytoskeletal protein [Candidatus Azambacteria bacterium]
MKKILFLSVLFAVLVVVPVLASGATFKIEKNYYLNSGSTINDNLHAAGANVSIAGTVNGDLFTAGSNVLISGPVNADLSAAAGALNVNGNVVGDMRLLAGNVNITSSAGGELIVVAGQANVMPGSVVSRDVRIIGGNVNYSGSANGGVNIKGGQVYINGIIEKDLSVTAREITLGPGALIKGNFDYYSPKEAVIEQGATVRGVANFHKTEMPAKKQARGFILGIFTLALLVKTIMFVVASLAVFYLARTHVKSIVREASSNFWKEALRGFVLFVVVPVAMLICFVTIIGITLGMIALFIYLALLTISAVIAVLLFAQLAFKYIFKKENYELNWWVVILAVLALGLIALIPIVGWLFIFIIFLSALGSFANYIYKKLKG